MHRDFADWYRLVDLEPKDETLEKRWKAVEEFAASLNVQQTLELIRLFYAKTAKDTSIVESFREHFKVEDATFPMRGNDAELSVLAGATIVELLDRGASQLADTAALGMVCVDFMKEGSKLHLQDMVEIAGDYLRNRSKHLRKPHEVLKFTGPDLEVKELIAQVKQSGEGNSLPNVTASLIPLLEKLTSSVAHLVAHNKTTTDRVNDLQQLRQEESNILWWLFAEYSRDLGRPMGEVGFPGACVVAAKELADLTEVLPGPLPAQAFLDKMLQASKSKLPEATTLQKAVNACPREWRNEWVKQCGIASVEDLCVILCAVKKSLETDGVDDWIPVFEKATGVSAHRDVRPLELAYRAYEESLFLRAIAACEVN